MAPLSPETRIRLQDLFQGSLIEGTAAEDLPEIAEYVNICNTDGLCTTYIESHPLRFSSDYKGKTKRKLFRTFFHVRRVLLSLTNALEGEERCKEIDDNLMKHSTDKRFLFVTSFAKFLLEHYDKESLVIAVLKCISRSLIKPVIDDLKNNLGSGLLTDSVPNSWRVTISISPEKIYIIHTKREQCSIHRFELKWEFTTSIFLANPSLLDDIHLTVPDLRFNVDFITPKFQAEAQHALKGYLPQELAHFIIEKSVIPINPPLMVSGSGFDALIEGEQLLGLFENVRYSHSQLPSDLTTSGRLVITNYKIVLASVDDFEVISIPLTTIAKLTHKEKKEIEFICKEILIFRLVFVEPHYAAFLKLMERVFPIHPNQLFAPLYCEQRNLCLIEEKFVQESMATNGWRVYNPSSEFKRLKLTEYPWRLTRINATFQLCPSYPKRLVLPEQIEDGDAIMAAQVRVNGRIPVITWKHRNGALLSHGSGLVKVNSRLESIPARDADKKLFNSLIRNCCDTGDGFVTPRGSAPKGHLRTRSVDGVKGSKSKKKTKSRIRIQYSNSLLPTNTNAVVADFYVVEISLLSEAGKIVNEDIEDSEVTTGRETLFVESLSDMKDSYRKLQKLCLMPFNISLEEHWLTYVDGTNWLEHLRTLMESAHRVVELISIGSSVFLSYAEAEFDRACQISSLAQLWLDPYYRTLNGFIVLVEKEWLSFGHPFLTRCGYLSTEDGSEVAPVFMQFLDCVWQTMQQFPHHFEFNNKMLIELSTHVYSSLYGTFIYDNEQDRRKNYARSKTESFWTHVISDRSFKNPLYVGDLEAILVPSYDPRAIGLWTSYFLRWYPGQELVSLPRTSTEICGQDILSLINDSNNFQHDAREFTNKLNILKQTEKELTAKIAMEREKLELIRSGMTMAAAKEVILLRRQSNAPNTDLEFNGSLRGAKKRRKSSRKSNRRSTPSSGFTDEIVEKLKLSTEAAEDISPRARTARSFTDGTAPGSPDERNSRKKKSRSRSRGRDKLQKLGNESRRVNSDCS